MSDTTTQPPEFRASRTGLTQAVLRAAANPDGIEVGDVPGFDLQAVSAVCSRLTARGVLFKVRPPGRKNRFFSSAGHAMQWVGGAFGAINPQLAAAPVAPIDHTRPAGERLHTYGTVYAPTILPTERPPVLRAGSTDHERCPSRMGDTLVYRGGQVGEVPA
jgi:hypothetical protein